MVVDAWEWVVTEGKWSEDDGGGEVHHVQSLLLSLVVIWPCLDKLPPEQKQEVFVNSAFETYGAGHLVTATFGQPPIWQAIFFFKSLVLCCAEN